MPPSVDLFSTAASSSMPSRFGCFSMLVGSFVQSVLRVNAAKGKAIVLNQYYSFQLWQIGRDLWLELPLILEAIGAALASPGAGAAVDG